MGDIKKEKHDSPDDISALGRDGIYAANKVMPSSIILATLLEGPIHALGRYSLPFRTSPAGAV